MRLKPFGRRDEKRSLFCFCLGDIRLPTTHLFKEDRLLMFVCMFDIFANILNLVN